MAIYNGFIKTSTIIGEKKRIDNIATGIAFTMDGDHRKRLIKKKAIAIEKYRLGKRRPAYLMGIGIPSPTTTIKVIEQVEFQPRVFPVNYRWVKKKN